MLDTIKETIEALESKDQSVINKIYNELDSKGYLCGEGAHSSCFYFPEEGKVLKICKHAVKREVKMLTYLKDLDFTPNLYDYGEKYLVMDYIEGYTLEEAIEVADIFSNKYFWDQIEGILETLRQMHVEPFDMHDENIIITNDNKVYLIDLDAYTFNPIEEVDGLIPEFMHDHADFDQGVDDRYNDLLDLGYSYR